MAKVAESSNRSSSRRSFRAPDDSRPPARNRVWARSRTLSVPDINRLKTEWERFQKSEYDPETMTLGKLQIDVLNIRTDTPLKRPRMRVKMGSAQYFTARSETSNGDWNEGFIFVVSYHAQLFDTIDLDLYDKPYKHWPAKSQHVGKAKLRLSRLAGRDDVFITFLPIYEYHPNRSLPADIQQTLISTEMVDLAQATGRITHKKLIGSVQVRIRYRFQTPDDVRIPDRPSYNIAESESKEQQEGQGDKDKLLLPTQRVRRLNSRPNVTYPGDDKGSTDNALPMATRKGGSGRQSVSQHGRGELAQDERFIDSVFNDKLSTIMNTDVPGSQSSLLSKHKRERKRHWSLCTWICEGFSIKGRAPSSSQGKRYGFSQKDSDDNLNVVTSENNLHGPVYGKRRRKRDMIKRGANYIIQSANFGDKNFASQWMRDSFDDVAIAHPAFDRLVGIVVSRQTRALVRAVMKLANAFGQGFKVNSIRLLKAIIILEKYYKSQPRIEPGPIVTDRGLIDEGCHYFRYALIAYGWRGLCYLGSYGKFLRDARHRQSNKYAIIRYLELHPEDLLGFEYGLRKGAVFQPSYFVAIDRSRKNIVLSIRGTWSLYDAITDLVCEYMPFRGGLVHAGMLASAQWFYTNIVPQIFRYVVHHSKDIKGFIITGHSLGGGTASLVTMMVLDQLEKLRKLTGNPSFRVHCYSYAPVALASRELNHKFDDYIHSFICHDDIVGRMSYGTAMQLKELIMDTISAYDTLGGWYKVMTDPKKQKLCFEIISRCREQIYQGADKLYPLLYIPGNIIYIRRFREHRYAEKKKRPRALRAKRFTAHHGSHAICKEMFITKSCIEDHMLAAYQHAFEQLRGTYAQP